MGENDENLTEEEKAEKERLEAEEREKKRKETLAKIDPDVLKDIIQEQLKPIKEKLDEAYSAKEKAENALKEKERLEAEKERERLLQEGKHKEVYEADLAKERSENKALRERNVALTRDIEVRDVLGAYEFRSDKARQMATAEIVGNLVQGEDGAWKHKSGIAIADYVKLFFDNKENSFLLKAQHNSGGGTNKPKGGGGDDKVESVFGLSQDEVIKRAEEGRLPHQQKR